MFIVSNYEGKKGIVNLNKITGIIHSNDEGEEGLLVAINPVYDEFVNDISSIPIARYGSVERGNEVIEAIAEGLTMNGFVYRLPEK